MSSRVMIIFASALLIAISLAGGIAALMLRVAQQAESAPPTVEISAVYPGAYPQVVADTVAAPLEQQVNGVEGMTDMSSRCTDDGACTLTVTFRRGTDLNVALVLVQNRVALAQPMLPEEVQRQGVTVRKGSESKESLRPAPAPSP